MSKFKEYVMSNKIVVKNAVLRCVVLQMVADGYTEKQFIEMASENFLDFEKGKKTTEEYWQGRVKQAFEPELATIRELKKTGIASDAELAEPFRFARKNGNKRKEPPEKSNLEKSAKAGLDAIMKKLTESKIAARENEEKQLVKNPTDSTSHK